MGDEAEVVQCPFNICWTSYFCSNFNIFIDYCLLTQISTFWSIWPLALKFQHFDWFPILYSNFNVFIDSPSPFTQIWTFWSIFLYHFALKFQHFDRFLTLSSNFNIPINSLFCNQIPTFWSIHTLAKKYQHLINLPFFRSNFNILIDPAVLNSNFNILINSHLIALKHQLFDCFQLFTQISTFW